MEKKLILNDEEVDEYFNWEKEKDEFYQEAYDNGQGTKDANRFLVFAIIGFIMGGLISFIIIQVIY